MEQKKSLYRKLAKYSAAAGAVVAMGGTASGQIVHTEINDTLVDAGNPTIALDLNNDATNDITFNFSMTTNMWTSTWTGHARELNHR